MNDLNQQMLSAAFSGDLSQVETLVKKGADINYIDSMQNFAMFTAAWEGNIEALNLYHALEANITFEDANLLCNAAYNAKANSVRWLLAQGAEVNFSFKKTGENALHYTISKTSDMKQRADIVQTLISAGINVNKQTSPGESTLCFMRDAFLKGETPLHRAAAYADTTVIKMLLDAGAIVSTKDANGDTPMSWGSWHLRDADILRLLTYEGVARIG